MNRRTRIRTIIFFVLVAVAIFGRIFPEAAPYPAAASPFVAAASLIGTGHLNLIALLLAVPTLLRRRWLCRYVCPLGFCLGKVGWIRRVTTGSHRRPAPFKFVPKIGAALALFTLIGVGFHVPGFLGLDPWVIFGSIFQGLTSFLVPVLAFLLLLEAITPGLWCGNLCPLGGVQDMLYTPKHLYGSLSEMRRDTDETDSAT